MDTSLDNANSNPFVNSNGADNDILSAAQKTEGLLLNLSDTFNKQNGGGAAAGDFYHNSEKANGKRLASEFDDDEEEEDDDDLGPETDVDAIDDALSPSIVAAKALADGIVNNNPEASFVFDEKADLETDLDLQKKQSSEFDGQRSPREETPTPPADTVHDGGLEDNVADSGEESEDEWNYIKGEEANKENISPSQPDCEVADLLEETDNMSQLNPNAAEFVPVSPTRSIPSPVCRAVLNDPVIAQSPKRPSDIDINLPNPQEFENEVKSRPSDFDSYSNGHDNDGDQQQQQEQEETAEHKSTSQELMENLLNGKNIDEIPEFQPGSTPTKVPSSDEFHFGPNAAPFTPAKLLDQSEATLSTKAVYGDDESALVFDSSLDASKDNVDFVKQQQQQPQKEEDPMSMSFYDEKTAGDAGESFDLNKVQTLPEDIDEFLNKPDETVGVVSKEVSDEVLLNNDERIQTTDLDKMVDEEKELASPVSNEEDLLLSGTCELSKSPNPPPVEEECKRPESKSPLQSEEACSRPESKSPEQQPAEEMLTVDSPEPAGQTPEPKVQDTPEPQLSSPEPEPKVMSSPEPQVAEETLPLTESPVAQLMSSPEPNEELCQMLKSPVPEVMSPQPTGDVCFLSKTPEPEKQSSEDVCLMPTQMSELVEGICILPGQSPVFEKPSDEDVCFWTKGQEPQQQTAPEDDVCCLPSKRPEFEKAPSPQLTEPVDVCLLSSKSPEPAVEGAEQVCKSEAEERKETPESAVEDVTSSVKDVASPPPAVESPIPDEQLNFAQQINAAAVQETVTTAEATSTIDEEENRQIPISTPQSVADTESVTTGEMNSFLERSQMSDLTSPLSPGDQPLYKDGVLDKDHPLMKCVYPLPTEIKTETITPEFAEPAVLSPAEQTKEEEAPTPTKETVEEAPVEAAAPAETPAEAAASTETPVEAVAAVAAAAAAGVTAVAAAAVAEKKPAAKPKTGTTTTAAKKAPVAKSSPTKPAPSPTKTKATPSAPAQKRLTTAAKTAAKTTPTASKTSPASAKPAPRPKTATTTTAAPRTTSTDKKPTANGEAKTSSTTKTNLTARKASEAVKTTTKPTTGTTSKTSPTKPTARPSTAPARPAATATKTTTSGAAASTSAAPKPGPSTLLKSSTSSTARTTTTSTVKATASKTTTSPKPTSSPKPRPTTAPLKPKAPVTKTVTKAASVDAEKQSKDSANKLTASRTASARSPATARTVTSTVKKTEAGKATGSTRTTLTKTTTTTTTRSTTTQATKKPAEIVRNKTKTTKIEKPMQNGVSTVVTEQITLVNNSVNESDQQLMKDNSPIDNKLIVEQTERFFN